MMISVNEECKCALSYKLGVFIAAQSKQNKKNQTAILEAFTKKNSSIVYEINRTVYIFINIISV